MKIIETSDSRFYQVVETGDANLAHVWHGLEVKPLKDGGFVFKKPAHKRRSELVRKAGSRIVREG